ncbi:chemotaxis protein CheD [Aliiglaciecola sp. CAU 1673]|uniref:chemotaxis protein CheD n=1 Tax=Aliiglaciecola sp. CAU 1673 TaxID=3032595 RepID=UPI0023DAEBD0|nr:chemotaxis protein CheD [Aliiglaciecola sp. CAU 1673]MDF2178238.1 chemotaxis protein CheD [Aliiglaciecola sp. CAU 1673]
MKSERKPWLPASELEQAGRIVIHAGELVFGKGNTMLNTLLGSCVSITLWHPTKAYGGMCHFALARRPSYQPGELDARYADDCIKIFENLVAEKSTKLSEYEAKIFGGSDMLSRAREDLEKDFSEIERNAIGDVNSAEAFRLLLERNVRILEADVGEKGYRKVAMDMATGETQVEFVRVG